MHKLKERGPFVRLIEVSCVLLVRVHLDHVPVSEDLQLCRIPGSNAA